MNCLDMAGMPHRLRGQGTVEKALCAGLKDVILLDQELDEHLVGVLSEILSVAPALAYAPV